MTFVLASNDTSDSDVKSVATTSPEPLSDAGYVSIGVYVSLVGCMAFAGNVIVLLVILCQKAAFIKLHNLLLVNLASADLLVTLASYPMTALSSFYKRWIFGDLACQVGGFLVFMFTMVSLDTLTFIAITRYILVCKPKYHHVLRMETGRLFITVTWVHAVVWTALPLLGWNRYVPEAFKTSCTIDWHGSGHGDVSYVVLTILTCYILHMAVIVFCYSCVLRRSRRLTFGARKHCTLVKLEEVLWHHRVETEREVTKMCGVMIGGFLVCWTPYAIISALSMCGVGMSTQVATLPTMFAKLSCALNPAIYVLMSSKFREAVGALAPWSHNFQHRHTRTTIELSGEPKLTHRGPVEVREYRGDMTNQGVYIGYMAVSLEVKSTVF